MGRKFSSLIDETSARSIAHIYFQLGDGSIWEGIMPNYSEDGKYLRCDCEKMEIKNFAGLTVSKLFHTDVSVKNFDSVKQIRELLESNPDDFFEKIIDPETYIPTELGAKIIRNIVPNEESINKLYSSLKTIEKRAKWFDVSRLLRYSDVEGDPATLVASMLKESIKGSMRESLGLSYGLFGISREPVFELNNEIPENLKSLLNSIFEGYIKPYPPADDAQTKERILKIICFFIDLADLLSNGNE